MAANLAEINNKLLANKILFLDKVYINLATEYNIRCIPCGFERLTKINYRSEERRVGKECCR